MLLLLDGLDGRQAILLLMLLLLLLLLLDALDQRQVIPSSTSSYYYYLLLPLLLLLLLLLLLDALDMRLGCSSITVEAASSAELSWHFYGGCLSLSRYGHSVYVYV